VKNGEKWSEIAVFLPILAVFCSFLGLLVYNYLPH